MDLEYYVPRSELDGYLWNSELRLDLVVHQGNEFLPVELKYKTRSISRRIERFGELLTEAAVVVKNQGARTWDVTTSGRTSVVWSWFADASPP